VGKERQKSPEEEKVIAKLKENIGRAVRTLGKNRGVRIEEEIAFIAPLAAAISFSAMMESQITILWPWFDLLEKNMSAERLRLTISRLAIQK
jgi:hypothetical protein